MTHLEALFCKMRHTEGHGARCAEWVCVNALSFNWIPLPAGVSMDLSGQEAVTTGAGFQAMEVGAEGGQGVILGEGRVFRRTERSQTVRMLSFWLAGG